MSNVIDNLYNNYQAFDLIPDLVLENLGTSEHLLGGSFTLMGWERTCLVGNDVSDQAREVIDAHSRNFIGSIILGKDTTIDRGSRLFFASVEESQLVSDRQPAKLGLGSVARSSFISGSAAYQTDIANSRLEGGSVVDGCKIEDSAILLGSRMQRVVSSGAIGNFGNPSHWLKDVQIDADTRTQAQALTSSYPRIYPELWFGLPESYGHVEVQPPREYQFYPNEPELEAASPDLKPQRIDGRIDNAFQDLS